MPISNKSDVTLLTDEQREVISKVHNLNSNQELVYFTSATEKQIHIEFFGAVYRAYLSGKVCLFQQIRCNEDATRRFDYLAIGKHPPYQEVIERARD
jgi:hypothetical protein